MIWLAGIQAPGLIDRLGWMVVHSLWLGLLVALALAAALRLLARASPQARYVAGCVALAGLLGLTVAAFLFGARVLEAPGPGTPVDAARSAASPPPAAGRSGPGQGLPAASRPRLPWKDRAVRALRPAMPYVTVAWVAGVLVMSLRQLSRWRAVGRTRRLAEAFEDPALEAVVARVARRIGLRRGVELLACRCVRAPAVMGWLRAALLLPLSFGSGLTPAQVEAILAHELAHVRRLDYLVNLVQTAIETLLFYHPAVWYISRSIRQERESACDAVAISVCGDREGYADALVGLAKAGAAGSPAVAASGGSLLCRVRYVLGVRGPASTRSGLIPAMMTLVLASVAAVVAFGPSVASVACVVRPVARRGTATAVVPGSDLEALTRLARLLRRRAPAGWSVASIRTGRQPVWNWDPPKGEGDLLELAVRDPSTVERGKPLQIFLWLMDGSYTGRPPSESEDRNTGAPREIARWRGRRVLLWGDGRHAGWPDYEADILAALRETDRSPSGVAR